MSRETKDQQIIGLKARVETQAKLIEEIKKNEVKLIADLTSCRADNYSLRVEAGWLRENFSKLLSAICDE